MKKYKYTILLGLVIFGAFLFINYSDLILNGVWDGRNDLRLGIVSKDRIAMVSVSLERKMINAIKIEPDVPLWVPKGPSWYRTDRIEKLLTLEKKKDLAFEILFYNFGFISDRVLYLDDLDSWRDAGLAVKELGLVNWLRLRRMSGEMIYKEEAVSKDLKEEAAILDEVMMRDFADNRILNSDIKISIINTSEISGLANFIATKLEWAGFSVIGVESSEKVVDDCLMVKGRTEVGDYSLKVLENLFGCEVEEGNNQYETELYFGERFAEMLKYSSYRQSF
ncbi:MAG: hypothetical protein ACOX6N_00020 [Patescibacteria group bacterium]